MSILSDCRAEGFFALSEVGGEVLAFGAASVDAVVNRKPTKLREVLPGVAQPNFKLLGMSEIEVNKSLIEQPVAGNDFKDSYGYQHRVQYVVQTDITWICYCQPSLAA